MKVTTLPKVRDALLRTRASDHRAEGRRGPGATGDRANGRDRRRRQAALVSQPRGRRSRGVGNTGGSLDGDVRAAARAPNHSAHDHAAVRPRRRCVGMLRFPLRQSALEELVRAALQEDGAFNDLTTIATVVSDRRSRATLCAREAGVVCGVPLALEAFRQLDPKVSIRVDHEDGATRSRRRAGAVRDRARARAALGGTRRAELPAAPVGDRHAHGALRRGRWRDRTPRSSTRARRRPAGARSRSTPCAPAAGTITAWICRRGC